MSCPSFRDFIRWATSEVELFVRGHKGRFRHRFCLNINNALKLCRSLTAPGRPRFVQLNLISLLYRSVESGYYLLRRKSGKRVGWGRNRDSVVFRGTGGNCSGELNAGYCSLVRFMEKVHESNASYIRRVFVYRVSCTCFSCYFFFFCTTYNKIKYK